MALLSRSGIAGACALALVASFSIACGDTAGGAGSAKPAATSAKPASTGTAKPTTSAAAPAPTPKPTAEPAAEMVETDLSSRGDEWKGFTIKAPKDAKVMEDLGDARVAVKGFDVVLSQKKGKTSVKDRKKGLEDLAKQVKGKVSFSNETAEGFDYKLETPKLDNDKELFARDDFFMVVKVGGKDVGCFPHTSAQKEEIAKAREACKTVAKK